MNLQELKATLPAKIFNDIMDAWTAGDPDWLYDMIAELDTITPDVPHYLLFHNIMQAKGITSKDFDTDALHEEIKVYIEGQMKEEWENDQADAGPYGYIK